MLDKNSDNKNNKNETDDIYFNRIINNTVLREWYTSNEKILYITGISGIGKTTLIKDFCKEYFGAEKIYYINLSEETEEVIEFIEICEKGLISKMHESIVDMANRHNERCFNNTKDKQCFDNTKDSVLIIDDLYRHQTEVTRLVDIISTKQNRGLKFRCIVTDNKLLHKLSEGYIKKNFELVKFKIDLEAITFKEFLTGDKHLYEDYQNIQENNYTTQDVHKRELFKEIFEMYLKYNSSISNLKRLIEIYRENQRPTEEEIHELSQENIKVFDNHIYNIMCSLLNDNNADIQQTSQLTKNKYLSIGRELLLKYTKSVVYVKLETNSGEYIKNKIESLRNRINSEINTNSFGRDLNLFMLRVFEWSGLCFKIYNMELTGAYNPKDQNLKLNSLSLIPRFTSIYQYINQVMSMKDDKVNTLNDMSKAYSMCVLKYYYMTFTGKRKRRPCSVICRDDICYTSRLDAYMKTFDEFLPENIGIDVRNERSPKSQIFLNNGLVDILCIFREHFTEPVYSFSHKIAMMPLMYFEPFMLDIANIYNIMKKRVLNKTYLNIDTQATRKME